MDYFTGIENDAKAASDPQRERPLDYFSAMENPGPGVAQEALDRGLSFDDAAPIIAASGLDPRGVEGQYRLTESRRQASADPQTDAMSRRVRAIGVLPVASTVQQMRFDRKYKDALVEYEKGNYAPAVLDTIARYEERGFREQGMGTGRAVGEAALKVPGMIAEFGGLGKVLKGVGMAGEAATVPGFAGRSAAMGVLAPSMTAQTASQRSVEATKADLAAPRPAGSSPPEASSWHELRNLAPAAAVSTANAAVLGSLQKMSVFNAVPTLPGRALAKGGAGLYEQSAVDSVGAAADLVLHDNWKTKLKTGGTVGDVLRGEEGATKSLLAQAVTFTLFAGAHDPAVLKRLQPRKLPAPAEKPVGNSPLDAAVDFINKGGKPEEANAINTEFMDLINDPRTAGDAFEIMKERMAERKADANAKAYAELIATNVLPAIERYKAASERVSPADFAKQRGAVEGGFDRDTAWKDAGFPPLEDWTARDVRDFAKGMGIKNAAATSTKVLRKRIMDEFVDEQNRLAGAAEARRRPIPLDSPTRTGGERPQFVIPETVDVYRGTHAGRDPRDTVASVGDGLFYSASEGVAKSYGTNNKAKRELL